MLINSSVTQFSENIIEFVRSIRLHDKL